MIEEDQSQVLDFAQADDDRDPTIVEAVTAAIRGEIAQMRTAIAGVVQNFNAATQRCSVQAGVQITLLDGTTVSDPLFVDVPVCYPGAGGYGLAFPLAPGDEVLLVFAERSIDEWLARGGYNRVAYDPRRFSAQDAIASPGLRSAPNAIPAASIPADAVTLSAADGSVRVEIRAGGGVTITASEVRLGDDSATFLALASLVDARVSAIVSAFNAHVHTSAAAGSLTTSPTVILPGQASVAASKSKGV